MGPLAAWFARTFAEPTPAQAQAWPAIRAGRHVLVAAPTGSGKTLAAFLATRDAVAIVVPAAALVFLIALGALGAWAGGAPMVKPTLRVGFWGALAMAVTAGIGAMIGKAV